jgi:hypothetical protein
MAFGSLTLLQQSSQPLVLSLFGNIGAFSLHSAVAMRLAC